MYVCMYYPSYSMVHIIWSCVCQNIPYGSVFLITNYNLIILRRQLMVVNPHTHTKEILRNIFLMPHILLFKTVGLELGWASPVKLYHNLKIFYGPIFTLI